MTILELKGSNNMAKTQEVYSLDDLFISINDIYQQFDMGKINESQAHSLTILCCKEYLNNHKEEV